MAGHIPKERVNIDDEPGENFTLKEAKEKKLQLQEDIEKQLNDFTHETGLNIEEVEFTWKFGPFKRIREDNVEDKYNIKIRTDL